MNWDVMEKEDIDYLPMFTWQVASWAKLNKASTGEAETIIREIKEAIAA